MDVNQVLEATLSAGQYQVPALLLLDFIVLTFI